VAGWRRGGVKGGKFSPFRAIIRYWLRQNKEQRPKSLRTNSNSVVNVIVSKRQAVRPECLSSIPDRVKRFFLLHSFQTISWHHQSSLPSVIKLKRPGREANHSPPSSAENKNARNHISTSLYVFMLCMSLVKQWDNFNFTFYFRIFSKDVTGTKAHCLKKYIHSALKCLCNKLQAGTADLL